MGARVGGLLIRRDRLEVGCVASWRWRDYSLVQSLWGWESNWMNRFPFRMVPLQAKGASGMKRSQRPLR
jgi:hypothetical protein